MGGKIMTRKIRQLNRVSRQGRQSALALTLCLALALGAGLIAANPAAALVLYTDITDVTLTPVTITSSRRAILSSLMEPVMILI